MENNPSFNHTVSSVLLNMSLKISYGIFKLSYKVQNKLNSNLFLTTSWGPLAVLHSTPGSCSLHLLESPKLGHYNLCKGICGRAAQPVQCACQSGEECIISNH